MKKDEQKLMKGTRIKGYKSVSDLAEGEEFPVNSRQGVLDLIKGEKIEPVEYIGNHYLIPIRTIKKYLRFRKKSKDGRVKQADK